MKTFVVALAIVAAVLLAISPAHACANDGDTVTLHGTIVQSSGAQEGTGLPEKFMAIVLPVPLCTDMSDHAETLVEVSPVSKKWLGHYVVVTGIVGLPASDRGSLSNTSTMTRNENDDPTKIATRDRRRGVDDLHGSFRRSCRSISS
jgi:hypothetical protein